MFYAVPGIALAATTYTYISKSLIGLTKCTIVVIEMKALKRPAVKHLNEKIWASQVVLSITIIFTIAAFFNMKDLENYRYLDAVYFGFVSLTTIGFGDFEYQFEKHLDKPYLFATVCCLFFLGLGIMASVAETSAVLASSTSTGSGSKSLNPLENKTRKGEAFATADNDAVDET